VVVYRAFNVAVVVVVVGKVPVTSIEANAVRQDLEFLSRTSIGLAVCSGEVIGASDVSFLLQVSIVSHSTITRGMTYTLLDSLRVWSTALSSKIDSKACNINLCQGRLNAKDCILRGD
jgi:hypothetical protein